MKIEKLTENKIRVIMSAEDLGVTAFNIHSIMTKALETQEIFSDILKKAEREVDFCTDGCKLLIEAFSSSEDVVVFTITKYFSDKELKKKKLVAKRKSFTPNTNLAVCQFNSFEAFCEFCKSVSSFSQKKATLYEWKSSYYLIIKNINAKLYASLSEFGKVLSCSEHFETKLLEHGKVMIKKNAIDVGVTLFAG